ncbi:hypothetical protein ACHQM5_020948 [Ranunculus cassubicifolius]
MSKYGLQLRRPPQNQRNPVRPANVFGDDDDDDTDVNKVITRQATNKRSHKDIEEQHKKALEEDPSVFDYDGVYDQMKEAAVRPILQDRKEKKSKYIETLMAKAKERERNHEIVYERKLAKERSQDEHLFADKDKFVTSAYKRKLAEQEKWKAEERLRELREERDDVTKKDISDFYFNLSNNVAFGATKAIIENAPKTEIIPKISSPSRSENVEKKDRSETPPRHEKPIDPSTPKTEINSSAQEGKIQAEKPSAPEKKEGDHHKKKEDALAAAKERFLARKKAKVN